MPAKKVCCDCGKVVQEQSDEALVRAVQEHARDVHRMHMTPEQVLSMAEPA
jgi:predicted small metal-binding protein